MSRRVRTRHIVDGEHLPDGPCAGCACIDEFAALEANLRKANADRRVMACGHGNRFGYGSSGCSECDKIITLEQERNELRRVSEARYETEHNAANRWQEIATEAEQELARLRSWMRDRATVTRDEMPGPPHFDSARGAIAHIEMMCERAEKQANRTLAALEEGGDG